jgi:hypothetical protein
MLATRLPAKGLKVVSVTLTGYAYQNGRKVPGSTVATLENGEKVYLGDHDVKGFDGACDAADKLGFDTTDYRHKLDVWVETGKFPQ